MSSTSELPDIPGLNVESELRLSPEFGKPAKSRSRNSFASLLLTGFLSVAVSSSLALAITVIGKDGLLVMVGVTPATKKEDALSAAINEQQAQLKLLADALDNAQRSLADLQAYADARVIDIDKLTLRVTNVERFSSGLERKLEDQKKTQRVVAEQKQKAATAKPAPTPVPVIPFTLVSIRSQADTPLVSLRDGLDKSDLLMPGDTWRGWTFLEADVEQKSARFKVAGKIQELRL